MIKGQEIVVPVKKDKHNFLNAVFLAMNGDVLLGVDGAKSGDNFNEFTGDGFLKPNGATISTTNLTTTYGSFIRTNEEEYDQTKDEYKNNDQIIFDFCDAYAKQNPNENYFFLIREKGETTFRFPEIPNKTVFIPENVEKEYIVFLECEVSEVNVRYYNLVASFSGVPRSPYCSRYIIKNKRSGRGGCSLSEMSKQQPVVDAINAKIQEVERSDDTQNINTNRIERLKVFRNTVGTGLSIAQIEQARVSAAVTNVAGPETETESSKTGSEYTPSVEPKAPSIFAELPSFMRTLVPGENICRDKTLVEMLKTNKRPSLFSGGRRYKKTTQRRRFNQNKSKRRSRKNV
jgi:hypothetical protein